MPRQNVHGIELHYELTGEGEPLLFIHGLGSSARDWEYQVPHFAPHYTVITVDIRGHGRSDKPRGSYSMAIFAADLAELLRSRNLAPAHIVGLSLGGSIAFELAVIAPDVVRSLTIVNSAPGLPPGIKWKVLQRIAYWQRALIVKFKGMHGMAEVLAPRLLPAPEDEEKRRVFIERWAENDKHAYRASFKTLLGWSVTKHLDRITQPTLVLTSEHDYTPLDYKTTYVAQMPNAELVVIDEAHHLLPVEKPEPFNEALLTFLSKQTAAV